MSLDLTLSSDQISLSSADDADDNNNDISSQESQSHHMELVTPMSSLLSNETEVGAENGELFASLSGGEIYQQQRKSQLGNLGNLEHQGEISGAGTNNNNNNDTTTPSHHHATRRRKQRQRRKSAASGGITSSSQIVGKRRYSTSSTTPSKRNGITDTTSTGKRRRPLFSTPQKTNSFRKKTPSDSVKTPEDNTLASETFSSLSYSPTNHRRKSSGSVTASRERMLQLSQPRKDKEYHDPECSFHPKVNTSGFSRDKSWTLYDLSVGDAKRIQSKRDAKLAERRRKEEEKYQEISRRQKELLKSLKESSDPYFKTPEKHKLYKSIKHEKSEQKIRTLRRRQKEEEEKHLTFTPSPAKPVPRFMKRVAEMRKQYAPREKYSREKPAWKMQ